ncbi:MAG: nucleotidyltransferase domain-containing protein [Vallitalea sp.]|jgi:predicted nucleotidyltransferase|nr:nucleotidyltransferase domain-containing protein [Vallitalea sp.]
MKKIIPINNVKVDYDEVLECIIRLLRQKQKDNLVSIFLTGSYARGDATDSSDLDVWCIFEYIDSKVLHDVGIVAQALPVSYNKLEVNSQCFTIEEIKNHNFSNWNEEPVKILDAVLLFGEDLFENDVSVAELKLIYKRYLVDVLMSIRHYISVDEPKENLTYHKIRTYILKPLMFPLRMERYCVLGYYPNTNSELLESCKGKIHDIVEYFLDEEKFNKDINLYHREVLSKMHDSVLELINL